MITQSVIAQLGERQTEDLKVPGWIPGLGILSLCLEHPWQMLLGQMALGGKDQLLLVPLLLKGTWCSGITSTSHAEGPGFKSQCVHLYCSDCVVQA